jgi:nucleoside-diphosphate kinase
MMQQHMEQTLVLIKPDALKVSLTGYILSQFSEFHTGLRFAAMKVVHVSRLLAEEHYAEHKGKFFFPSLIEYITGRIHYPDAPHKRRVIALVYSGPNAVKTIRDIAGNTNPHKCREQFPNTIRALGTIVPVKGPDGAVIGERMDNLVHASANDAEAEREVKLWFRPSDLMPYMHAYATVECDQHYYYCGGKITTEYVKPGICLFGPGETIWASDLEAVRQHLAGQPAAVSSDGIVAKYLINTHREAV